MANRYIRNGWAQGLDGDSFLQAGMKIYKIGGIPTHNGLDENVDQKTILKGTHESFYDMNFNLQKCYEIQNW